jgi:hypothetical protein
MRAIRVGIKEKNNLMRNHQVVNNSVPDGIKVRDA